MRLVDSQHQEEINLPTICPSCFNTGCIEHLDLGTETDSHGTFDNHEIVCNVCGRRTLAMDTFEDAVDAFLGTADTVIIDNEYTVLLTLDDVAAMVETCDHISFEQLRDMDLRRRNIF